MQSDLSSEVWPASGVASLSEVLPSVLGVLGVPGAVDILGLSERMPEIRRVAVLLVDGLGSYSLDDAARDSSVLAAARDGELGELRQLTATFPSTTPVSLASLCTGAPPGEHGIMAFNVNTIGDDILTHIFWNDEVDPATFQPLDTCFARASAAGIATTVVDRAEHRSTGLNRAIYRGARQERTDDTDETVRLMRQGLRHGDRSLVYGYMPHLDRAGHEFGLESVPWREAVRKLDGMLDQLIADLPSDTAVIITSDHGMIDVPEDARIDIAAHAGLREGVRVIAGEPRVRYVHTHPGAAADVRDRWAAALGDAAWVLDRDTAIAEGLFGEVVRPEHATRVGEVVAIARQRHVLLGVWECDVPKVIANRGHHGGLTPAEMMVPLWTYRGVS